MLKKGWTQEWAHVPVQLRIVFNNAPEATNDVDSTRQMDVNCLDSLLEWNGITNSSHVEAMVYAYQRAIMDADTAGTPVIVVPLFPYSVETHCTQAYVRACLEVIVNEVRNSQCIHEVYVLGDSDRGGVDKWMMRHSIGLSEISTVDVGDTLKETVAREGFSRIMEAIRTDINRTLKLISWEYSQQIFRVSKTRYFLLGQMMPYLLSLWFTNIAGPLVIRPKLYNESVIPNTMLTMQEQRPPTIGHSHFTNVMWGPLLFRILLNEKPGTKRYITCPRMACIEEPEFDVDGELADKQPTERAYEEYFELIADEQWLLPSIRTQRVMHGMCRLELKLDQVSPGDINERIRWSEVYRLINMVSIVLKNTLRWRRLYGVAKDGRHRLAAGWELEEGSKGSRWSEIQGLVSTLIRALGNALCWVQLYRRVNIYHRLVRFRMRQCRRWRRVVGLLQEEPSMVWTQPAHTKCDGMWLRYTASYPWARIVPLIISLTRRSFL